MKSIKGKILFLVISVVLISSLSVGLFSIIYSYNTTLEKDEDILQETCTSYENELNSKLDAVSQSVDTLSKVAVSELDDLNKFKTDKEYVKTYTEKIKNLAFESGRNTKGAFCVYVRYNPEFTEPTSGLFLVKSSSESDFDSTVPTDFSTYDPTDLAHVGWYYIPVNNGKPTWMNPYLNENINVYMISYVVPIYKDGVSVGIVGMDVEMPAITSIVDKINLYDNGHGVLVNPDKTVAYSKKIETGKSLTDAGDSGLKQMADNIDNNNDKEVMKYTYEDKENDMVTMTLSNGMKLVVSVPTAEIKDDIFKLVYAIIAIFAVTNLICIVFAIVLGRRIAKPINKVTEEIIKVSDFDFTSKEELKKLTKKKDETGRMAIAVMNMQEKLRDIIMKIDEASDNIVDGFSSIQNVVENVNQMSTDNSATTEEIAAGMQETSANTEVINKSIGKVKENTESINVLTNNGAENAKEVSERAAKLKLMTQEAVEKTEGMYKNVVENMNKALEQTKAVEKINELTTSIMDISSQTSLLSLNASIESARAGEAGKGFSVVANEIGELSNQTQSTVESIQGIIQEVNDAVIGLSDCMKETTKFIEENVLGDYSEFMKVGDQYSKDAENFDRGMRSVNDAINVLATSINEISNSIHGINVTVGEATNAVTSIAQKTSDMVDKSNDGYEVVNKNADSIENLKDIVHTFKL